MNFKPIGIKVVVSIITVSYQLRSKCLHTQSSALFDLEAIEDNVRKHQREANCW